MMLDLLVVYHKLKLLYTIVLKLSFGLPWLQGAEVWTRPALLEAIMIQLDRLVLFIAFCVCS
jgi:hypothetical protein